MLSAICINMVCTSRYLFTGEERDTESGNDSFGARYYAEQHRKVPQLGSSGPWAENAADLHSWNSCAYARNNSLSNIDPSGLDCIFFGDTSGTISEIDHGNSAQDAEDCANAPGGGGQWVNGYTDESQMAYDSNTDSWNISSSDQNDIYYTTISQADPSCVTNCQTGYSSFP